ncbi:MAG: hypothetical protein AAB597_00390 [Patescibacteria group bacterium]
MMRLKVLLVAHKWAVGLAILSSIIVSAPQIYFRIDHHSDGIYQGIELLPDSPWSARAREVQDGHSNFGAIYYKDGKDNPYLFQPLGSMVVAYTGQMFGLNINDTFLLARLLFTALVSLLIYAFVYSISRRKLVALSSAAILLLAESVLNGYGLLELFHGRSPDDFLRIARPVNPAMIYIFFFGFLGAFYKFYEKLDEYIDWKWGSLSVLFLGLNFYNYFYSWTYLFAFGGILGLSLLIRKKWPEALGVATVFVGALIVAISYILNLYQATLHPNYLEVGLRNGIIETHTPLFVGFTVVAILIAFLFWFPRENKRTYFFGLALLLVPFITMNQQILSGKVLQASHYHWFFHKPMAVIFGLLIVFYLLEKYSVWRNYHKVLAGAIIITSIGVGVFVQASSYKSGTNDGGAVAIERQKYGPVVDWLNKNATKEAVVFGNNEISHMVVIYTPLNVFYHRAGMFSLASTKERLLDIIFTFYRLRGVSAKESEKLFFTERDYLSANIYGMHYRELFGSYEAIPDEKIQEVAAGYKETLKTPSARWLSDVLKKYQVEYAVWDKKKDPSWGLDQYSFFEKTAEFGDLDIYRLVSNR